MSVSKHGLSYETLSLSKLDSFAIRDEKETFWLCNH
jgi:hypothetical protein